MKKFNHIFFIKKLLRCSPRQLEGETRAGKLICANLKKNGIPFTLEYFTVAVPKILKEKLTADGKEIHCKACSFIGGKIRGKEKIISSMFHFDSDETESPNININPYSEGISCVTHYFAPALAIEPKSIAKIIHAKKIFGEVKIKKTPHRSFNILVGNAKNPKKIFFNHYDSINMGAYDNASGVSATLGAILARPGIIKNNLYIFAGAEELSYDKPIYWAYGYREFEKKHLLILNKAKKIIVVDCVGASKNSLVRDPHLVYQAFPIKNVKLLSHKIFGLFSGFKKLLPVYHSDLDDGTMLKKKYLRGASRIIIKQSDS